MTGTLLLVLAQAYIKTVAAMKKEYLIRFFISIVKLFKIDELQR